MAQIISLFISLIYNNILTGRLALPWYLGNLGAAANSGTCMRSSRKHDSLTDFMLLLIRSQDAQIIFITVASSSRSNHTALVSNKNCRKGWTCVGIV